MPGVLEQLTCANTGWMSLTSSLLTPTNVFGTCQEFGYGPNCGGDDVDDNYVYEFGNGMIKMIIPSTSISGVVLSAVPALHRQMIFPVRASSATSPGDRPEPS